MSIYLIKLVQLRYGDKLYVIDRFVNLDIWIKGLKGVVYIKRDIKVIKNLSIKLLIGTDILGLKKIIINVTKQIARIK